jgi:hypothetical protein
MLEVIVSFIIGIGGASSYASTALLVAWFAAADVRASGTDWIWISLYSALWIVTVPVHFAGSLIYAFYTGA